MGQISVPFIPYTRLAEIADVYLAKHHPSGAIPIPIDDLIDVVHKIDVVPVSGLMELNFDAHVSRDMGTIYVDEGVYKSKNQYRFRFSLAHELAHLILHRDVLKAAEYNDVETWKAFIESIPPDEYSKIEYQAYALAGLLLVPRHALENQIGIVRQRLNAVNMKLEILGPAGMKLIAKTIGETFNVSSQVIHKRATKDGHWSAEAM